MRESLPTVQMLLVFHSVLKTGGFARAAEMLNLTPAAISYQIKSLERILGSPLFERRADCVTPTRLAQDLAGEGSDILQRLRNFRERGRAHTHERMSVRLLAAEALASMWLLPKMADLFRHFPGRTFEVVSWGGGSGSYHIGAKEQGAHIALRWARAEDLMEGPQVRRLAPDRAVAVCSSSYRARLEELDRLEGWTRATLICPFNWPDIWERWGEAAFGTRIDARRIFLQNSALCNQAAAGGLGIAIAHLPLVAPDLESGRLVAAHEFALPLAETYFAVNINEPDSELFERFADWCVANMATDSVLARLCH
jgi:LysR family transcriptional regulator, glycine cleavage system transcriptional activator